MSRTLVKFTKNATFFPPSPHLQIEVEISYIAECEIIYDENGEEEEINLLELQVEINGELSPFDWPEMNDDGRKFRAYIREAARDALPK